MGWGGPLRRAATNGQLKTVKLLLDRGADVHADNDNALRSAAENGQLESVRLLLDRGADIHVQNDTALRWAAEHGHSKIVALLLDRGADIHADNDIAVRTAVANNCPETVRVLLDRGADIREAHNAELRRACVLGQTKIARQLLDRGTVDIHDANDYALRTAADRGHDKIVDILLCHGNYRRANPGLALIALATVGKNRDVATLINDGADIHTEDDLAIRRAAWKGHMLTVALLLGNFNNTELRSLLTTAKEPNLLQAIDEERQKRVRKAVRDFFRRMPEMEI